jgi:hypothetical protein
MAPLRVPKRETGKVMIAWGGAAFAQSISRLRLVDEYHLQAATGVLRVKSAI